MSRLKYVIYPGEILDGDGRETYVGEAQLARLYGIQKHEYIVVRNERDALGRHLDDLIPLYPRSDGDYTLRENRKIDEKCLNNLRDRLLSNG